MARFAGRVTIDLGTGDGRLPYLQARQAPDRLFVGVDANAAGLREFSGRAAREGLTNLLYVRAAVEDLPSALTGVADRVSVVLPWGSLLAAVALPSTTTLCGIRGVCQQGASLTIVLGFDPVRDRRELARLGLTFLPDAAFACRLAEGYAAAGFTVRSVRPLDRGELSRWPSSWARRLGHGRGRRLLEVVAAPRR